MNNNKIIGYKSDNIIIRELDINSKYDRGLIYRSLNTTSSNTLPDNLIGYKVTTLPRDFMYLGVCVDYEFSGIWLVESSGEFHTCLLDSVAGQGRKIAEAGLRYMFLTRDYLTTHAPTCNRAAIILARRLGFTESAGQGTHLYGGTEFPMRRFTMTKEEYNARCTDHRGSSWRRRCSIQCEPTEGTSEEAG